MTRTVACLVALALGCIGTNSSVFGQQAAGGGAIAIQQQAADPAILAGLNLDSYTLQDLATPEDNLNPWAVEVVLGGQLYVLELRPHSVRSDRFQVLVQGEDGIRRPVEPPAIQTFKGAVRGIPGSSVRGSFVEGGVEMVVVFDDGSTFGIQPTRAVVANAPNGSHVVYDAVDVVPTGGVCGGAIVAAGGLEEQDQGLVMRGTAHKICEIAVDGDFEFYQDNGSNVTTAVNDIESTMNGVEGIYENNTGVTFEVTTIVIRSSSTDPYSGTDSGALLNQVGAEWGMSVYAPIRKDLVHLMTGRDMASGVLGIAWLTVVCGGNRYGLSERLTNVTQRRAVVAHEVGHNFSAEHCNSTCNPCQIMCAGLGGCSGVLTAFSTCEATGIAAYADSRPVSCLPSQPASIAPPFNETFPSTTLDATKWVFNQGAAITTLGMNEPSAPNSLEIDAAGNGLYQDDDIRTHFILMAGVTNPILRYSVQARGVASGKQFIVEVWTNQLRWVVKNTITSDGVDDATYTEHTHVLSGVELHNEFRVRFRPLVDSTSENWYVDNVFVGSNTNPTGACCISGVCTTTTQANCSGTWTNGGACDPNPCSQPTGACCYPQGLCFVIPQSQCTSEGGTFSGFGTNCSPNNCPQPAGACCYPEGFCFVIPSDQCDSEGGTFQGMSTNCSPNNCPQPTGACCFGDGTCQSLSQSSCESMGGAYEGDGTPCNVGTCPVITGACCLTASCTVTTQADCTTAGGTFQGIGTACGPTTCSPEMGACCTGVICAVVTSAQCASQGGSFRGANTPCNDQGNNTQPCCRADFDQNGTVEVPDIFGYLSAWFANSATADFDGGGIAVPDIFAYLSAWFANCQ